jgi:alpha-galactosidase
MLEIGNGGLTLEEERTHFVLWAISKSPLIIGCDLSKISKESLAILKHKELIAINQDPMSFQAKCIIGCDF